MREACPSGFIDIRGKNWLTCTTCGYRGKIPPREIDMEKLEHMDDVRSLASFSTNLLKDELEPEEHYMEITNTRRVTCLRCGTVMRCFDEFSRVYEAKDKIYA